MVSPTIRGRICCRVGVLVGLLPLVLLTTACPDPAELDSPAPPRLIAHAGGVGDSRTDTNSLEALNTSVRRGHTAIEVDLSWTIDGHLVLLHDWDETLTNLHGRPPGVMTLDGFRSMTPAHGLTLLDLDDLATWMRTVPDLAIVTDIKRQNVEGLRIIAEQYPDLRGRFVPQIYAAESLDDVRRLGFDRVILSLYRGEIPDDEVVDFAVGADLWGVTMPAKRAVEGPLPALLSERGVRVFAHTVNAYPTVDLLRGRGVYGVYTDWLSPSDDNWSRPLPAWTESTIGETSMGRWVVPFVPFDMDGMETRIHLRNSGESSTTIGLILRNPGGEVLVSKDLAVGGGGSLSLDLSGIVAGHGGHGWIEMEASAEVDADVGWSFRDTSSGEWKLAPRMASGYEISGPGSGLGGVLVAVVNPTDTNRDYRLVRWIGGEVFDDEVAEIRARTQLLRIYRSWTEEEISIVLGGGPMVAQVIRWDPLGRYMR